MVANELNLVFLWPDARRHTTVLIGIHFVLGRHRIDAYALGRIGIEEFLKVLGVGSKILSTHAAAEHRVIELHPSRGAPRRAEQPQVRIQRTRLLQNRQDVFTVMFDGEALQFRIGLRAVGIAICLHRIVAGTYADASDRETHLLWIEPFPEQLTAYAGIEAVQCETSG